MIRNFQVKSIGISISIDFGNTGPVITRNWIDTKICSIAHLPTESDSVQFTDDYVILSEKLVTASM